MNPDPRSKYVQLHIRFWCRGQIAVSARQCIDRTLTTNPEDAQAMIEEWIIRPSKDQITFHDHKSMTNNYAYEPHLGRLSQLDAHLQTEAHKNQPQSSLPSIYDHILQIQRIQSNE